MAIAQSRITAQGQISVPAEVRRKLGLGPGSVLEWAERGGEVIVRKAGRHSSEEVHRALFGADTVQRQPRATVSVKEGISTHIRRRHARD
jgi:AbrB family looped-hinge helix DNA binding protein